MADIVDVETRSRMMRGIRSKNTRPEMMVRQFLHAAGFRYRLHDKKLPGTPDIVFAQHRAIIFVSGCFWHGHDCRLFKVPATRPEFWMAKIDRNRLNDAVTRKKLLAGGWRVATVWECALRGSKLERAEQTGNLLMAWLRSDEREISLRGD